MNMTFPELLSYLLRGLPITIEVSVLALLLGTFVSVLFALGRMSRFAIIRWPTSFVVELLRGSSALVQLFWAFYVLPFFGIVLSPFVAGVIVLGLNEASYFSEVVRAALNSVLRGQRDAVVSLHLPARYAFFRITIPQALPLMIPPFGNAAIGMLKFSSLVSLVTLQDLTFQTHALHASSGDSAGVYAASMFIYLALALITVAAIYPLERYVNRRAGRTTGKPTPLFGAKDSSIPKWAFGK
jgi:polar amino acid transport system permease protein